MTASSDSEFDCCSSSFPLKRWPRFCRRKQQQQQQRQQQQQQRRKRRRLIEFPFFPRLSSSTTILVMLWSLLLLLPPSFFLCNDRNTFLFSYGYTMNTARIALRKDRNRRFGIPAGVFDTTNSGSIPILSSSKTAASASATTTTTALNVWWFGGSEQEQTTGMNGLNNDESCELVAVRIERPTSNSRRIMGDISIPGVTVDDVWSILTDYDQLSIHVPNLKESRIIRENNNMNKNDQGRRSHRPGDGSYQCQLYQVGAQKIIGFNFSAAVTMDMTERILSASTSNARKIYFKCVDSQFFSEFDGSWTVQEQRGVNGNNSNRGTREVLCSYDVLVRPKGPVPVAALEWRIREDVPINLRAVKAATLGMIIPSTINDSSSSSNSNTQSDAAINAVDDDNEQSSSSSLYKTRNGVTSATRRTTAEKTERAQQQQMAAVMVDWEQGETMAKYLEQ